jgi:hypothetical protein
MTESQINAFTKEIGIDPRENKFRDSSDYE